MKILHCCLANFYVDDFSYQENILPRIQRDMGHEVEIVASTETYIDNVRLGYTKPRRYSTREGVPVTRLPYVAWLPKALACKLRVYSGLSKVLQRFQPDVVYLHDCQFLSIGVVTRFARRSGACVLVDCHTDNINSGRSAVSRHVLHGVIYRYCARKILPVTHRFYATLPLRAKFLTEVYGIPPKMIELLPFGADDHRIRMEDRSSVRAEVRAKLGIGDEQLVFVAGGKIDKRKGIHTLANVFCSLSNAGKLGNAVLVIFGKAEDALQPTLRRAEEHPQVRRVAWIAAEDIYRYFWASDVAVFPGTHSVLWEEAAGLGLPCIFKRWSGIEHVDLGGNCVLMDKADDDSLAAELVKFANDPDRLRAMTLTAREKGPMTFSYVTVAQRVLGDIKSFNGIKAC